MPQTENQLSPGECSDLFAFAGVRKIIGDPYGKLMQDEVADRIKKLVGVLQQAVGCADAMKLAATHPGMSRETKAAWKSCGEELESAITEAMPEWDAVLKAVHEANAQAKPCRTVD